LDGDKQQDKTAKQRRQIFDPKTLTDAGATDARIKLNGSMTYAAATIEER
jgi:hypothetical protein